MKHLKVYKFISQIICLLITICFIIETIPVYAYNDSEREKKEKEEKKMLLHGYNALSGMEISKNEAFTGNSCIIDENSGYLEHIHRSLDYTEADYKSLSSSQLSDIASFYSEQIGLDVFGHIFIIDTNIKAQFNTSTSLRNIMSQKYDFYTAWVYRYNYISDLSVEKTRKYLSQEFKEDLYAVDNQHKAEELFNKYGTHLFTGIVYGGRMNVTNYMVTNSSSYSIFEGTNLEAKIEASKAAASAGAGFSFEEKYTSDENTEFSTSNYQCHLYGGNAPSAISVNHLLDSSVGIGDKKTYQYDIFFEGIRNKENLMVVAIPKGAGAIPIWELIDDNEENAFIVRKNLIECYTELCSDKYEEYLNDITSIKVSAQEEEKNTEIPTFNGIYVKTPQDYMYYVEKKDLESKGAHEVLHEGDIIYLDISNEHHKEIKLQCNNCTVIDESQGIIKMDGRVGGTVEISFIDIDKPKENPKIWISCKLENHIFEGGTGTEKYPYIIVNKEQFLKIQSKRSSHYILYKDIDFNGEEISCLGDFDGVLDGNYCTLSKFTIKNEKNWGLFSINNGTIKNLKIENAGTSIYNTGFEKGGIDYRKDYLSENYNEKAISALNAGIICAENKKTIENCCLESIFIRNIINNGNYLESNMHIMDIGSVCGKNSGTIKGCLVNGSAILGSFINLKDKIDGHLYVYCGGICGQNDGGFIDSCVVDFSSKGSIFSQCYNIFGKSAETSGLRAFAGGLVGFCDNNVDIKYCYVYIRNETSTRNYKIIDSHYVDFSNKKDLSEFNALRSATCICGSNCSINGNYNIVICNNEGLKKDNIRPIANGDNLSELTNSYEHVNTTANFSDGTAQKIDLICDYSMSYKSDNTNLGILHSLQRNPNEIMNIELQGVIRTEYYNNQYFVPENIHVTRYINNAENGELNIYKIKVFNKKNKSINVIDKPLDIENTYCVELSIFEKDNAVLVDKDIEIKKPSIIDFEAINPKSIYMDEAYDYQTNWLEKVDLIAIYSDGSRKRISDLTDTEINKIETTFEPNEVSLGDNLVGVTVKYNSKNYKCSYILGIDSRSIKEIKLNSDLNSDTYNKKTFETGTKITKDKLEGLYVELVYSDGDNKIIEDISKNEELEIIDGIAKEDGVVVIDGVEENRNYIILASKDYSCWTKLELKVVANKNTTTPTEDPEVTTVPKATLTPSLSPTEIPNPTPTDIPEPDPVPAPKNYTWLKFLACFAAIIVLIIILKKVGVLTKEDQKETVTKEDQKETVTNEENKKEILLENSINEEKDESSEKMITVENKDNKSDL